MNLTTESVTTPSANQSVSGEAQPTTSQILNRSLDAQRQAFTSHGQESYEERKKYLLNLKLLLTENREAIIEAINKDYGNRSYHETLLAEVITVVSDISSTIKHLKKWMKVQKRSVDQSLYFGAKNRVIPQGIGVVGFIIPWNFPLNLSFSGLSAAFAAGNRAMVKMSENSVNFSELLQATQPQIFQPRQTAIFHRNW